MIQSFCLLICCIQTRRLNYTDLYIFPVFCRVQNLICHIKRRYKLRVFTYRMLRSMRGQQKAKAKMFNFNPRRIFSGDKNQGERNGRHMWHVWEEQKCSETFGEKTYEENTC